MQMLEIIALENGAHNNQSYHGVLPEGWALIPDELLVPDTFPFVEIEVKKWESGDLYVVSMTPGEMPEPEPEPEAEPSAEELIDIMLGVTSND